MQTLTKLCQTALIIPLLLIASLPATAQDIVGYWAELCEKSGGFLDEDSNCLEPIEANGGDETIELIPVEELIGAEQLVRSLQIPTSNLTLEPITPVVTPGPVAVPSIPTFSTTPHDALLMCLDELELNVQNCHFAYPSSVKLLNECVAVALRFYGDCVDWALSLPFGQIQE